MEDKQSERIGKHQLRKLPAVNNYLQEEDKQ